jgi:hypothetical protein
VVIKFREEIDDIPPAKSRERLHFNTKKNVESNGKCSLYRKLGTKEHEYESTACKEEL